MKTVKRIKKLCEAVNVCSNGKNLTVCDIATDHGYLAEELSKQDNVNQVIATDISEKCLNKLVDLIKLHNLKKIETIVGDGLLPIKKADVAVVAGVGGWEIIKMLKNQNVNFDGTTKCNLFVLQPAQNVIELRKWLFENEIFIIKDYIIEDAGRFYPIIIVDISKKQSNEMSIYNLWLGRDNKVQDKDFALFLQDTLNFLEFLNIIPYDRIESDEVLFDKFKLKQIIEMLLKK